MEKSVKFSMRPAAARLMVLQVVLIPVGFMPVLCISFNVLEVLPLHQSVWLLALPAVLFAAVAGWLHPPLGRILLHGWLWGIVAVALYDLGRIPFILSGWHDFIPRIGEWLLNRQGVPGIIGYTWRYLGNGGGMGMSFLLLLEWLRPGDKHIHLGIGYGLFVFLCLMLTLELAPNPEAMFRLTPLTFTGSLIGHLIYGGVLGWLASRYAAFKTKPG